MFLKIPLVPCKKLTKSANSSSQTNFSLQEGRSPAAKDRARDFEGPENSQPFFPDHLCWRSQGHTIWNFKKWRQSTFPISHGSEKSQHIRHFCSEWTLSHRYKDRASQIGLIPACLMWSVNPCTVFLKEVPEKMYYIPMALRLSPSHHPY